MTATPSINGPSTSSTSRKGAVSEDGATTFC